MTKAAMLARIVFHLLHYRHRPCWLWNYYWPGIGSYRFVCAICEQREFCNNCGGKVEQWQTVGCCGGCVIEG